MPPPAMLVRMICPNTASSVVPKTNAPSHHTPPAARPAVSRATVCATVRLAGPRHGSLGTRGERRLVIGCIMSDLPGYEKAVDTGLRHVHRSPQWSEALTPPVWVPRRGRQGW